MSHEFILTVEFWEKVGAIFGFVQLKCGPTESVSVRFVPETAMIELTFRRVAVDMKFSAADIDRATTAELSSLVDTVKENWSAIREAAKSKASLN